MNFAHTVAARTPLEGPEMSVEEILAAATVLGPKLTAAIDECNELGCLPKPLMEDLRAAGVFRIGFPDYLGGPQMRLADQTRLIEILSAANPSAGWSVMILADSGYFAGMLEPELAREIWPRLDMATSAVSRPPAKAVKVEGGYRMSGRLGFASGVRNADRITVQCHKYIGDNPVLDANGQPEQCIAFPPLEAFVIHDAWDTVGMRGTGSTQISIDDVFIPEHLVLPSAIEKPTLANPPLSRYVNLMFVNQLGVILGVTKTILEMVEARLAMKTTPERTPLVNEYRFRVGIPHAWGQFQAASAYVYTTARECDDRLFANEPVPPELLAKVSMMSVIAAELCRKAVDSALELLGSDHIFRSTGIDRLYADLRVASTHIIHRPEALHRAATWRQQAAAA